MREERKLKIGFDVAQTCGARAGCAWYADALIHAMADVAPQHEYYLYHRFGRWHNAHPEHGTRIDRPGVHHPSMEQGEKKSADLWKHVASGKAELPGSPDIVQSNSFQAPKVGKARLVVVVYDVSFWAYPEFTTEGNRLTCQRGVLEALDRADGFLFISQSSHDEFERFLPGWLSENRKPWAAIPLASRFSVKPKITGEGGGYWAAVGSIEPRKNYDALLTAMELYWKRSPRRFPLHIAGGKGWCNEEILGRIAALEKAGVVRMLGYVPDEALPGLYQGARGMVFPSWYEGFGLPVLEAMQCGCPVICSGRASLGEIGGDAVKYIDPADPASICEAMLQLEGDEDGRNRLIQAGMRQAERFSWEATARATLDFYAEVLTR